MIVSTLAEIEQQAKSLPANERALLAERLIESLDELSPEENEKLWLDECERRLEAVKSGKLRTMSSEEFFARADQALNDTKT